MKIVLTNEEHQAVSAVKNMFGLKTTAVGKAITSITKTDSETTVEVNPGFTVDYCDLIMTMAPMIKGLYSQAKGVFAVLENLGGNFDAKWAKKEEVQP